MPSLKGIRDCGDAGAGMPVITRGLLRGAPCAVMIGSFDTNGIAVVSGEGVGFHVHTSFLMVEVITLYDLLYYIGLDLSSLIFIFYQLRCTSSIVSQPSYSSISHITSSGISTITNLAQVPLASSPSSSIT